MRVLFLDCFSGISGDMTVGALCDLGVKPSTFEWELSKVEIGDFHMHFERRERHAIEGVKFGIHEGATHTHDQDEKEPCGHDHGDKHEHAHGHPHEHEHEHSHTHAHSHEEHSHHGEAHVHSEHCCHGHHDHAQEEGHRHAEPSGHHHEHTHEHTYEHGHSHASHDHEHAHAADHVHGRGFAEIRALIEKSDLSDFVKKHAVSIFKRIAIAEGKIHGKPPEEVGFHEVGALDSIADIICACVGIEALGVERIAVSPLHDGRGWIECAHGRYPIPAAATLEILQGIPVGQIDEPFEFITPTGAAIVAEFGESFGLMPRLRVSKIGYGIGTRKLASRPNVLRAVLGEMDPAETAASPARYQTDTIVRIETNLDDLSPEITGASVTKLLAEGALDVFLTPIQMKKNRPGVQLTVLCEEALLPKMSDLLFAETTSFGLRVERMERLKLERKFETVTTPFGEVTVKTGLRGDEVVQVAPEFESCREASERSGQPLRAIYDAAVRGYRERQGSR